MAIIRLDDGSLMLHSPRAIDRDLRHAIEALGEVRHIVAPGTFHHLHVASAQQAFPRARTYICPGIERKRPDLRCDALLRDGAPEAWAGAIDQVVVRGNSIMAEVAFFHRDSRTLLLVDVLENVGNATPNTNWQLEAWFKLGFGMWGCLKPAPEYQMGWADRRAARLCLDRILAWDFRRIVMAHGDLIEADAHAIARTAWTPPLSRPR